MLEELSTQSSSGTRTLQATATRPSSRGLPAMRQRWISILMVVSSVAGRSAPDWLDRAPGLLAAGQDALGQIRWIAVRAPLRISMSMFESPLIDGRMQVVTSSRRSASAAASRDSRSSVTM